MNTLERLEYNLHKLNIPTTMVIENDDNNVIYLRSLFIINNLIVGVNTYDKGDRVELNINGTPLWETIELDFSSVNTVNMNKFIEICNKLIKDNLNIIDGETVL